MTNSIICQVNLVSVCAKQSSVCESSNAEKRNVWRKKDGLVVCDEFMTLPHTHTHWSWQASLWQDYQTNFFMLLDSLGKLFQVSSCVLLFSTASPPLPCAWSWVQIHGDFVSSWISLILLYLFICLFTYLLTYLLGHDKILQLPQ